MQSYLAILLTFIIAGLLVGGALVLSALIGPRGRGPIKSLAFLIVIFAGFKKEFEADSVNFTEKITLEREYWSESSYP
jgi:hypothetical protein